MLILWKEVSIKAYILKLKFYLLEELVKHSIIDLFWSCPIQLVHFFGFWIEGIDGSELAPSISEQNEEMLGLWASYLLQDSMLGCLVHHAREDTVLNCIKNYGPVWLGCWLFKQSWAWNKSMELFYLDYNNVYVVNWPV